MGANQKILYEKNLIYNPKSIQRPSLLARPGPYNYREAISPQSPVRDHGNTAENNTR
jgi:hypothetical protein